MHRLNFVLSSPPFQPRINGSPASVPRPPPLPLDSSHFVTFTDCLQLSQFAPPRAGGEEGRASVPLFFAHFRPPSSREKGKRDKKRPWPSAIRRRPQWQSPIQTFITLQSIRHRPPHSIDASLWHHSRCVSTFRKRAIAPLSSLPPLSVSST